mgnify:CR=1 FL=1
MSYKKVYNTVHMIQTSLAFKQTEDGNILWKGWDKFLF